MVFYKKKQTFEEERDLLTGDAYELSDNSPNNMKARSDTNDTWDTVFSNESSDSVSSGSYCLNKGSKLKQTILEKKNSIKLKKISFPHLPQNLSNISMPNLKAKRLSFKKTKDDSFHDFLGEKLYADE
mmetsp:Transcript_3550/g.4458  ORF Transcript_3550/g.4458 Transcript_3550/m.4458 type:complete len:128 (+) Transcript_3550:254-637(+)|eukprot:CAMPEP_0204831994 /NCGR_PEP_ID=MMETSP1346-20131115/12379_1 /ASSEMBLY_ACC=CAM_ASM_000771 /TAXON_ID=215587 /ORGANISM="Aplanochytrium stocchinoi, Strain GSBS06" /LENGTH=127 /DNA_ID=CAMNT_0051963505 /DNA_START=285 /DNA_END=668 /DNA_ORIENTATION=-